MPKHTYSYQFVISGLEQEDADWLMALIHLWINKDTGGQGKLVSGGFEEVQEAAHSQTEKKAFNFTERKTRND